MGRAKKIKAKKSFTSIYGIIFMVFFVSAVGLNLTFQLEKYLQIKSDVAAVQKQIDEEHSKNESLKDKKEYYKSDEYIEEVARDQLGLIMPDEKVFVNRASK